jgi:hypothetical protein
MRNVRPTKKPSEVLKEQARLLRKRYDSVQHIWTRETAMNIADWIDERAARAKKSDEP